MADKKEFPRSAVRFLRKLGQGQFGSVDLAEATNILPGEKVTLVALKSLHEGATVKNKRDFELEAESMVQFDHPNILQLLGVSFKDKSAPRCLIFEYMEKGDLNNYLRGCASSYIKRFNNVPCPARSRTESQLSDDPPVLSVNDLPHEDTKGPDVSLNSRLAVQDSLRSHPFNWEKCFLPISIVIRFVNIFTHSKVSDLNYEILPN